MAISEMPPLADAFLPGPYGHFDPRDGSYVVTSPRTPRPWINVLANDRYGVVLSQAGSGFSWFDNCQLFRISRWEQDLVQDNYGRYVYVTDLDAPESSWATTLKPTGVDVPGETVRHGLGFSDFCRTYHGIETRQTVFVPREDAVEVWILRVANRSERTRRLRLTSYLEWHLGGIGDWHREFHRLFMESRSEGDVLLAWKHPGLEEGRRERLETPIHAFVAWPGRPETRWITDKLAFLGPAGSLVRPVALADPPAPSTTPRWDDPIAAGMVEISLEPGEEQFLTFVIGAAPDAGRALALARKYNVAAADQELAATKSHWRDLCRTPASQSGDPAIDLMVGTWLPYQAVAGRLKARCAYYQQGGAYGYRDQLQDSLMLLDIDPSETLAQLKRHADAMYEDGGVRHWWHPETSIFVESRHSDTCLWLAFGLLEYLDATGNVAALDTPCRFLDRFTQKPGTESTLLKHALRGVDRALERRSPRGLPLIGAGDWNDGLSHAGIDGKGESVWVAMFLFHILTRLQPVLTDLGRPEFAARYAAEANALRRAVEEHAWDGEWYIAGTRDDGKPFGSRTCSEGRIFLNPQTWAVISGIGSPERTARAMQSVREHLVTDYGALLLKPAYASVDPYIGYITRYAPGLRENGGVYSHASTWAVQAFAMMSDRETALRIFRGMLPCLRSAADADLYAAEPYVMPGNLDGPDSPYAGRAGWTWYTGSAAWMRRIALRYLQSSESQPGRGSSKPH